MNDDCPNVVIERVGHLWLVYWVSHIDAKFIGSRRNSDDAWVLAQQTCATLCDTQRH